MVGILVAGMGVFILLLVQGALPIAPPRVYAPLWVARLAALLFVLAGAAVLVGYGGGFAHAGGELPPDTPLLIRLVQHLLGLAIVGGLTAIGRWGHASAPSC